MYIDRRLNSLAYFFIYGKRLGLYRKSKIFPAHSTPVPKARRRFQQLPSTAKSSSGEVTVLAELRSSLSGVYISSSHGFPIIFGHLSAPSVPPYNQV